MRLLVTALKELFWLSCLMWGILFMIAAATEGFPYTSIHIRGDFWQDAIGGLGLFLAMLGVYLGFAFGKTKGEQDQQDNLSAAIRSFIANYLGRRA